MNNKTDSFRIKNNSIIILLFIYFISNIIIAQWTDQDPFNRNGFMPDVFFINTQKGWCVNWDRILHTTNGGNNWNLQLNESREVLEDICFIDENNGWISGKHGTILKTNDGGENWHIKENSSASDLHSLHFVDASYGWAGGGDKIIKTTDGGETWSITDVWPAYVYSLYFSDRNNGWAVGIQDTLLKTNDGGESWQKIYINTMSNQMHEVVFHDSLIGWVVGGYGTVLKTTDGGNAWNNKNSGTTAALYAASFINDNIGWAVGSTSWLEHTWKTTNGGENWFSQNCGTGAYLWSVHFVDLNNGWAAGENGTLINTSNGGATWNPQTIGNTLFSVSFIDTLKGWAVGSQGNILFTSNGGIIWDPQSSGTSNQLRGVHFIDENNGWVAGEGGLIKKTTDSGSSWISQNSNVTTDLNSIFIYDINKGWAVGSNKILRTTNGGSNWLDYSSASNHRFKSIFFINENVGWAVGGVVGSPSLIMKTTNGGTTWFQQTSSGDHWLYSVFFSDENNGWAVGTDGIMLKTTNGGSSWSYQSSVTTNSLKAVSFISVDIGWVAGENGIILHTTDNGQSWSEENSGIAYEINSLSFPAFNTGGWAAGGVTIIKNKSDTQVPEIVELLSPPNGDYDQQITLTFSWLGSQTADYYNLQVSTDSLFTSFIYDNSSITDTFQTVSSLSNDVQYFWRVNASNGIGVGTWSEVWRFRTKISTADGWVVQNSGTNRDLHSIFFIDSNTGWAVGDSGIILKTTTGGTVWETQTNGISEMIYSVHFSNSNLGCCAVNGAFGNILRTTNGGNSWSMITGGVLEYTKDLKLVNSDIGFAVGDEGLFKKTTDGGENWITSWTAGDDYRCVDFVDENYLWAVGYWSNGGQITHSSDGGDTWEQQFITHSIYDEYSILNSVVSIDLNNIWVCGYGVYENGESEGIILKSTDTGDTWNTQNSNTDKSLNSIYFTNSNVGFTVGNNGIILNTTDGGLNWDTQNCQMNNNLNSVFFIDENTGWIAGDNGLILRTVNSGLPVELISFEAIVKGYNVLLNWQTATELNNYGFEVERSHLRPKERDYAEASWEKIGFVEGSGNSSAPKSYSYVDRNPVGGSKFLYRLKQIDNDGSVEYSEIVEVTLLPMKYELFQNYPNPFNPTTTIKFALPEKSRVKLEIFNVLGERVENLLNTELEAGYHDIEFRANNLSSGVYLYRINSDKFTEVKKMVILK